MKDSQRTDVVGDGGGTNFRLAAYRERELIGKTTYQTKDVRSFPETFYDFLAKHSILPVDVKSVVIPIAGPINGKIGRFTNADLSLDASGLDVPVAFVNDFYANAVAVGKIGRQINNIQLEHLTYGKGQPIEGKPIGIIGPGTGCGVSRIHFLDGKMHILDSEGSHVYAPVDIHSDSDIALARRLGCEKGIHLEGLASGLFMAEMFRFYGWSGKSEEIKAFDAEKNKGAFIARTSKQNPDSISRKVMQTVYKYTGRGAHNIAVHEIALGGIWLLGGMLPKDLPTGDGTDKFIEKTIMEQFVGNCATPHDEKWVKNIPVYAGLEEDIGIKGALEIALDEELFAKKRVN